MIPDNVRSIYVTEVNQTLSEYKILVPNDLRSHEQREAKSKFKISCPHRDRAYFTTQLK